MSADGKWHTTPAAIHALHDLRSIADAPESDELSPGYEPFSRALSWAACVIAIAAFAAPFLR